jgi:flavodoxin
MKEIEQLGAIKKHVSHPSLRLVFSLAFFAAFFSGYFSGRIINDFTDYYVNNSKNKKFNDEKARYAHLRNIALENNSKELDLYKDKNIIFKNNLGKVLVVYYSYSKSANTKKIAQIIEQKTKADIFVVDIANYNESKIIYDKIYVCRVQARIKNNRISSQDMHTFLHLSTLKEYQKFLNDGRQLPSLKGNFPKFDEYDVIIIGAPVWCYSLPLPLISFLKDSDFRGKIVAPFCTYDGIVGNYFQDFGKYAKDCKIAKGISFIRPQDDLKNKYALIENKITDWLNNIRKEQ